MCHTAPEMMDLVKEEYHMLKWFEYGHLPDNPPEHLQTMSRQFYELAIRLDQMLDDGPEKDEAFRNLLISKDAAVRARVHPGG